jgi:hypothetical protein
LIAAVRLLKQQEGNDTHREFHPTIVPCFHFAGLNDRFMPTVNRAVSIKIATERVGAQSEHNYVFLWIL